MNLGEGLELGRIREAATPGSPAPTEQLRLQGRTGICACGPRSGCSHSLLPLRAGVGPVPLRQVRDLTPPHCPYPNGAPGPTPTSATPPLKVWAAEGGAFLGSRPADLGLGPSRPPSKPRRQGIKASHLPFPAPTPSVRTPKALAAVWFPGPDKGTQRDIGVRRQTETWPGLAPALLPHPQRRLWLHLSLIKYKH